MDKDVIGSPDQESVGRYSFECCRNGRYAMGGGMCSYAVWNASDLHSEGFASKLEYCCNIVDIQYRVIFHNNSCCVQVSLFMQQKLVLHVLQ